MTTSQVFLFTDAHGNNLTGVGNLFTTGVIVKVVLNVDEGKAYIQNADTNKYLETALAGKAAANHDHQGQNIKPSSIEFSGNGTKLMDNAGELSAQISGDSTLYPLLHTKNVAQKTGLTNRNLLHNWYLLDPINSRGQASYTGNGYHVDRWRGAYTTDVTSITENGLKVENKRSSGYSYMRQYLDSYLEAGTYTLSILVKEIGSASVYIANDNGDAVPKTMMLSVGLNTMTVEVPANTARRVQFVIGYNSFVTLAAVKLERGSVQTLVEQMSDGSWAVKDVPHDKSVEALRCSGSNADSTDTYANKGAGSVPRIQVGTYTGTGVYGSSNKNTFTFNFVPQIVHVTGEGYYGTFMNPGENGLVYTGTTVATAQNIATWSGMTLSWYSSFSGSKKETGAAYQFNTSGVTYTITAMG